MLQQYCLSLASSRPLVQDRDSKLLEFLKLTGKPGKLLKLTYFCACLQTHFFMLRIVYFTQLYTKCHVHEYQSHIYVTIPDFLELRPMGLKTGLHVFAIIFENKRMCSSSRREVRILFYFEFTHVGLISNIYINFVHFLKLSACAYYQAHSAI